MIEAFNKTGRRPVPDRGWRVPSEFEAVVAKRTDRPVFKGELNPIFQGTYSSRIELKEWMRTHGAEARSRPRSSARWPAWLGGTLDRGRRSGAPGSRCCSTRRTTWPPAS